MNKSDYVELRNTNNIDQIIFNYYQEKGGTYDFQTCIKSGIFTFVNVEDLVSELDRKFNLTLVMYNDKLIKVQ